MNNNHSTRKTQKFRQMPGKTPMWGNPMREREIYYSASGKYISAATIHIPAREIHLQHTKTVPTNSASKSVPSPYCCTAHPENLHLESVHTVCCTDCSVWPSSSKKNPLNSLEKCAQLASIFVPSSPCCTDCTDPYSTASNSKKITQHSNKNVSLGFVPKISWEMCPLCCPNFPLSSLLENLSQSPSLVSCTLPNAFSYNLKVTLHLLQP
jgi:hypothetical protein